MPTGVYDRKNKLTPEQIREHNAEYQRKKRLENPEKYREIARLNARLKYRKNPEKARLQAKIWRANNIEKDKENQKRRYWKNPEYYKAQAKERARRNPEKTKNAWLKRFYGMTITEYNEMLYNQNGVCAICFNEDKSFSLSVDHDHKTGKIRGLLCTNCNLALGKFKDNPQLIKSAFDYLKRNE